MALNKGRAKDYRLLRITRRVSTLVLACGILAQWRYIESKRNPAYGPTRPGRPSRGLWLNIVVGFRFIWHCSFSWAYMGVFAKPWPLYTLSSEVSWFLASQAESENLEFELWPVRLLPSRISNFCIFCIFKNGYFCFGPAILLDFTIHRV